MVRNYRVRLRDSKGHPILTLKGDVVRKEQAKSRIAGDVDEILYMESCQLKYPKPRKQLNRVNLPTEPESNAKVMKSMIKSLRKTIRFYTDPQKALENTQEGYYEPIDLARDLLDTIALHFSLNAIRKELNDMEEQEGK